MRRILFGWLSAVFAVSAANVRAAAPGAAGPGAVDIPALRRAAEKLLQDSNFKEAFEAYRTFLFRPDLEPKCAAGDFEQALSCLARVNRQQDTDALREEMAAAHPDQWRALAAVARSYRDAEHNGFLVAGKFERGGHRGGGEYANAAERDRVRALQLMAQALPLVEKEPDRNVAGDFHLDFARAFLSSRGGGGGAWRLQYLSDLGKLPDYEPGHAYGYGYGGGGENKGAPVDEAGQPVFHRVPADFAAAATDGARWRWLLQQAAAVDPGLAGHEAQLELATFLRGQFGPETLAEYGAFFQRVPDEDDARKDESGTWALHTLRDNETIARLANGVKRFTLPDEFDFIRILRGLREDEPAANMLAEIFENRRQFPQAEEAWRFTIAKHGAGPDHWKRDRLEQITGNWGAVDPLRTRPAGAAATFEYVWRNGKRVSFSAERLDVRALLADVKAYLKTDPGELDGNRLQVEELGWRMVEGDGKKYVRETAAEWALDLHPAPNHFDRRVTVTAPQLPPGAYRVTAKLEGGNESRAVLWVADTAIVKKSLSMDAAGAAPGEPDAAGAGPAWYYVADARTGAPVADAEVEVFAYWTVPVQKPTAKRYHHVHTQETAVRTDRDGQVAPPKSVVMPDEKHGSQCLVTATTPGGRLAFLGFHNVWANPWNAGRYQQTRVYGITDRPVYRPKQKVHLKFWASLAVYDAEANSPYAGQAIALIVKNPKGEKVYDKTFTADRFGGLDGEYDLPADAQLGVYHAYLWTEKKSLGGQNFRVEEYKKPEFEVTVDAPAEPVMLGEKFEAKVAAKYYFGGPVGEGKAKVKVLRTDYRADWFPPAPWDWLYGPGYGWFGSDCEWYPGWRLWGCMRPWPSWWPRESAPPEVVVEFEREIGRDGTVRVEIDTALAKAIHGDTDHKYSLTVEVTDPSRRTIVGSGEVLVARRPFKVYAWVDRGFYRAGDVVRADFSAVTLAHKPVAAKGLATLYRVEPGAAGAVKETAVQQWPLEARTEGFAPLQLKASRAGQYRLAARLADAKGREIEGGCVFTVRGEGDDGRNYRFTHLELTADRREYAPGDAVRLLVNADEPGSTVALFVRPANGVVRMPRILRLAGKSALETIAVAAGDMPNFFVEALTVHDGQVFTETREICVPPVQRVLNVEVRPSQEKYLPGAEAKVKLRLTDVDGKPVAGSVAMSVYDKSVEYVAGGPNVPEIKAFFWKWRRNHQPQTEHNLDRVGSPFLWKKEIGMSPIGVFGASVADEIDMDGASNFSWAEKPGAGRGGGGGVRMARMAAQSMLFGGMAMMDAAPSAMPTTAMPAMPMEASKAMDKEANGAAAGGEEPAAPAAVRKEFADTAFWVAALNTDANGECEAGFKMPENLTAWKLRAWAMGAGTRVGEGAAEAVTAKNLILRLQAPRFFVEKDEVVLSANIHNYLDAVASVNAVLELDGGTLQPLDGTSKKVKIEPGGQVRVDWRVKAVREGEAVVRMKALGALESDAMEMRFPVYVHGMLKTESWSGALRPGQARATLDVKVPAERRPEQTRLEIRYSPTLAGAMVDALPYLADYPYGCTEQTLDRFLPTVIVQKILLEMGLDLGAIREKRTNLNAQEIGNDAERAKQWKRLDRNPVFDPAEVDAMVKAGLRRLVEMQLGDGGWGWFSGWGEHSSAHTTAFVVHGLQLARENGVAVPAPALKRGVEWLRQYQAEQVRSIQDLKRGKQKADALDAFVFRVLADEKIADADMRAFLFRDRGELPVYGLAMYGLALDRLGDAAKRDMVVRNIEQHLVQDAENQTAWLDLGNGNCWWNWYGSEYEAQACYLELLARTDPKGAKAAGLVKYLLNNRKHATWWNSTRDTALCLEAMASFLRASGEDKPDLTVEIRVDGRLLKTERITAANLFRFDNRLVLEGAALSDGPHKIEIARQGEGPLYFNAYLTNFTLEDPIARAGLEIKVERRFYKLVAVDKKVKAQGARGQAVDEKVEKYERVPLKNRDVLKSGELVEVELEIESKNDYEYVIFEDQKAAGFEPVEVRSGYTGNALGAYVEFRDERVVFFARTLARGKHSVAYRLRAEIPGTFSALPVRASAMYAPELRANSDEGKLGIED